MRGLAILVMAAALWSCATTPVVRTQCLPLRDYSAAAQRALGAAVAALPANSPLVGAMADYGALRAAARAACGVTPH